MNILNTKLWKRLTPYKQIVKDGYSVAIEYFWYLDHKNMDEDELIKLAIFLKKGNKFYG